MRAADPMFLTFQTGRLIGEDHLAAMRKLSHPKSHYFMKQRSESVINQVNDFQVGMLPSSSINLRRRA